MPNQTETDFRNRVVEAMARAIAGADAEDYMEDCCRYDKQASASLTALLSELDAAGWQIVPKVATWGTGKMSYAGADMLPAVEGVFGQAGLLAVRVYTAMLAAAPDPFKPEDAA